MVRTGSIREALDLLQYLADTGNLTDAEQQVLERADAALKVLEQNDQTL